jgi:hypothetical protein
MINKNITKAVYVSLAVLSTIPFYAIPVLAQDPPKIDGSLVSAWIQQILDIMSAVLIVATVVMGVLGSYMWITSTGDPGKVKQAQGTITWALIGLVFVLLIKVLITAFFQFLFY